MAASTIYYICFIPPKTGGELVNLQSVAALTRLGVRAVALVNPDARVDAELEELFQGHALPLERLTPQRQFTPHDIIVIPEFYRDALRHFTRLDCRCVLHTQNPFMTFRGFDSIAELNASGLYAGIACSTYGKQLMLRMGSNLNWHVVTPFVHPLFQRRAASKKLQVAYIPQKRPMDAAVVRALLHQRHPEWAFVPWTPIADMSRQSCAAVLAESAVFASFSWLEGLGLPPLEAMAGGALVCGFDGHGGSDYAHPGNGLWVRDGDHEGYADALAATLRLAQGGAADAALQLAAGAQTAAQYSQQRFGQELLAAWQAIAGPGWPDFLLDDAPSAVLPMLTRNIIKQLKHPNQPKETSI